MKRNQSHFPRLNLSPKRMKRYMISVVFTLICLIAFWIQDHHDEIRKPDSATPIELYTNQVNDDLTKTFSTAIDDAQKSILLIVYSLTDQKIINCLKNKSQLGINVKVICDAEASPYIDSKLGNKVSVTRRFGPGLMHQKILVTDNENVWLGSANMTQESLKMHGNLVAGFHCERLANEIHAKAETLKIEGRGTAFPVENFLIGEQPIELWFLPDNQQAILRLKNLIRSAQKTIRIAMFTWTRSDLAHAVIEASKRGVKAEVVVDRNSGKGVSANIVKLLSDNKINISLSTGAPLLHHKFLYIDEQILAHGSANWTKRAFTQNDDCFIVMHHLTPQQKKQMEALWEVIVAESSPSKD